MAADKLLSLAASLGTNTEEDTLEVLSEMETLLMSGSEKDLLPALSKLNMMDIFACLQSLVPAQIQVTCSVLERILKLLPVDVFHELSRYIELGLQHPEPVVIILSLHQVRRCCDAPSTLPLILAPTMLHLVTQLLGHESLDVVKAVHSILVKLCSEEKTRRVILVGEQRAGFIGDLEGLIGVNSTVRYRVYEMLVEISMTSEDAFQEVKDTGILVQLVHELEGSDFLVKLNCIEMLIRLQSSPKGCLFLEESDAIKKLHGILAACKEGNPLLNILTPGILKFFCNIPSSSQDQLMDKIVHTYPLFMSTTYEGIRDPNSENWGIAVDVIGVLGSSQNGRKALLLHRRGTEEVVNLLGKYCSMLPSDQKIRCLDSICLLLSWNATPENSAISQDWFHRLGENFPQDVFFLIRQPFPKERCAGLQLVKTLAGVSWGREVIKHTGGLLEYLLNRKSALGKEEKDLKFEVVVKLVEAGEESEVLFGKAVFLKLSEYHKDGPYYVKGENVIVFQDV